MQNWLLSIHPSLFSCYLCFLLHSCPCAVLTIENTYLHSTTNNRHSASHVSTSQKSDQLLYWWENRRSEWSTKQLSKGFGPMPWGRNCGACGCARAWVWLNWGSTPAFRRRCSQNWSVANCSPHSP